MHISEYIILNNLIILVILLLDVNLIKEYYWGKQNQK